MTVALLSLACLLLHRPSPPESIEVAVRLMRPSGRGSNYPESPDSCRRQPVSKPYTFRRANHSEIPNSCRR